MEREIFFFKSIDHKAKLLRQPGRKSRREGRGWWGVLHKDGSLMLESRVGRWGCDQTAPDGRGLPQRRHARTTGFVCVYVRACLPVSIRGQDSSMLRGGCACQSSKWWFDRCSCSRRARRMPMRSLHLANGAAATALPSNCVSVSYLAPRRQL